VSPTKNRDDLPQPSWKKSAFWKWGHTNKMIHSSLVSGDELTDVPTVDHRFWGIGRPWARQKYPEWGYWPVILRSDHLPGSSVKPPLRRKLWIKIGKVNGDHYRIAPDGKWSSLTEKVAEAKNNQIGSKSRLGMSKDHNPDYESWLPRDMGQCDWHVNHKRSNLRSRGWFWNSQPRLSTPFMLDQIIAVH